MKAGNGYEARGYSMSCVLFLIPRAKKEIDGDISTTSESCHLTDQALNIECKVWRGTALSSHCI